MNARLRAAVVAVGLLAGCTGDDFSSNGKRPAPTTTTEVQPERVYSPPDPSLCPYVADRADQAAPAPVQGVAGGPGGGSGEVRVSWTPSPEPDVACYKVFRATTKDGPFELAAVAHVDGTSVVPHPDAPDRNDPYLSFDSGTFSLVEYIPDTGVETEGCCLYYRVMAVDEVHRESAPSAVACAADEFNESTGRGCRAT